MQRQSDLRDAGAGLWPLQSHPWWGLQSPARRVFCASLSVCPHASFLASALVCWDFWSPSPSTSLFHLYHCVTSLPCPCLWPCPWPLPPMLRLEMHGLNGRMDGIKAWAKWNNCIQWIYSTWIVMDCDTSTGWSCCSECQCFLNQFWTVGFKVSDPHSSFAVCVGMYPLCI